LASPSTCRLRDRVLRPIEEGSEPSTARIRRVREWALWEVGTFADGRELSAWQDDRRYASMPTGVRRRRNSTPSRIAPGALTSFPMAPRQPGHHEGGVQSRAGPHDGVSTSWRLPIRTCCLCASSNWPATSVESRCKPHRAATYRDGGQRGGPRITWPNSLAPSAIFAGVISKSCGRGVAKSRPECRNIPSIPAGVLCLMPIVE